MKKYFVSDLDGTLLNRYHLMDAFIIHGIKKCLKKGHGFMFATGRHVHSRFYKDLKINKLKLPIIAMNGALIIDENKKVLKKTFIDEDIISDILANFKESTLRFYSEKNFFALLDKKTYRNNCFKKRSVNFIKRIIWQRIVMKDFNYNTHSDEILSYPIYKLEYNNNDTKTYFRFKEFIKKYEDRLNIYEDKHGFEIVSKKASKALALEYLVKYYKLNKDNIYVYGDGLNDYEMINNFQHAFIPKNAHESLKSLKVPIIKEYCHHGVIKHILSQI